MRKLLIGLTVILILTAITRFYRLSFPKVYYFDEVYHALTSKLIARNDNRAYEWWNEPVEANTAVDWLHPPLAKLTQGLSIRVWGENSFGWRFSSAFFGVLVVAVTALIAHVFFRQQYITLLAAFLAACDGLLLTQSRIAMNDIHVTFFILLTVAMYGAFRIQLEKKKSAGLLLLGTGIAAGLAMASKWSGVYILGAVWMAETIRIIQATRVLRVRLKSILRLILLWALIPGLVYLLSYSHMFLQGKTLICTGNEVKQGECYCSQESSTWVKVLAAVAPAKKSQFEALESRGGCKRLISHFSELHHQILWYQTHLNATHPYQSRPTQWALDLRPVWQYVDYEGINKGILANIYNVGNPLLFWVGLIVVAVTLCLFSFRKKPYFSWKIGFLLLVYFIVWAPWEFSPRIMFFYHYAPAVPIMAILIAQFFFRMGEKDRAGKALATGITALIFVVFLWLYPLNTGLPMSQEYFDTIFKLFPFWK